ncbi:hypothetical protein D3C76_707540 [compost metagenome]
MPYALAWPVLCLIMACATSFEAPAMLSLAKLNASGWFDSAFIYLSSAARAKKSRPVLRILG